MVQVSTTVQEIEPRRVLVVVLVVVLSNVQEIEPVFVPILFVELEAYQAVQARSVQRSHKSSSQFAQFHDAAE